MNHITILLGRMWVESIETYLWTKRKIRNHLKHCQTISQSTFIKTVFWYYTCLIVPYTCKTCNILVPSRYLTYYTCSYYITKTCFHSDIIGLHVWFFLCVLPMAIWRWRPLVWSLRVAMFRLRHRCGLRVTMWRWWCLWSLGVAIWRLEPVCVVRGSMWRWGSLLVTRPHHCMQLQAILSCPHCQLNLKQSCYLGPSNSLNSSPKLTLLIKVIWLV